MIRNSWMAGTLAIVLSAGAALAQTAPQAQTAPAPAPPAAVPQAAVPQSDMLLATLWTQRSVEFKANALTAFTLARYRLDEALADKKWTAAPGEQTGDFANLPPAVVLDVDETLVDNSTYQVWMMRADQSFSTKTWNQFCAAQMSTAIPGAVEFTKYADSKGIKVFYLSNRGVETEADTRQNMEKLGFPMGGNVDTMLMTRKQPDWGSAKGTRRAYIAKSYRILINVGDNFGDFVDEYRGSEAERLKVMEDHKARWGREWIMIANPSYGSFESAPYVHDFKLSEGERRRLKRAVLDAWPGP